MTDEPVLGVANHSDKLAQDSIVRGLEFSSDGGVEVAASDGELEPHLRLRDLGFAIIQLVHKRGLVAASSPRLAAVRTHGTR